MDRVVVYLDPDQVRWLREREAEALVAGERIGTSTVIRAALDDLMRSGKDWTTLRSYVRRRGPAPGERPKR